MIPYVWKVHTKTGFFNWTTTLTGTGFLRSTIVNKGVLVQVGTGKSSRYVLLSKTAECANRKLVMEISHASGIARK